VLGDEDGAMCSSQAVILRLSVQVNGIRSGVKVLAHQLHLHQINQNYQGIYFYEGKFQYDDAADWTISSYPTLFAEAIDTQCLAAYTVSYNFKMKSFISPWLCW
jgi:hypothetical protein